MSMQIPSRLFQIWGGGTEPPALAKASAATVRLLNPDFEYCFYDDARIASFIEGEFPQYAQVLASFAFPIQRYDFLRYLIAYRFGGFYFDLDVLLTSSLADLRASGCVFPFERLSWASFFRTRYDMDWEVGNYAFGAAPGHPFLRAVIENCIRAQNDAAWVDDLMRTLPWPLRDYLHVIYSTGPGLVTRTLAEHRNPDCRVRVLFPPDVADRRNWNRFGDYGLHLMQSNWRQPRGFVRRRLLNIRARQVEERAIAWARGRGAARSWAAVER